MDCITLPGAVRQRERDGYGIVVNCGRLVASLLLPRNSLLLHLRRVCGPTSNKSCSIERSSHGNSAHKNQFEAKYYDHGFPEQIFPRNLKFVLLSYPLRARLGGEANNSGEIVDLANFGVMLVLSSI